MLGQAQKRKKGERYLGLGPLPKLFFPSEPTANPSSQHAQPDYDAIIQHRFANSDARQMEFNNRLWEAVRLKNAQTALRLIKGCPNKSKENKMFFLRFLQILLARGWRREVVAFFSLQLAMGRWSSVRRALVHEKCTTNNSVICDI